MGQYLKEEVRERIIAAALRAFAGEGFGGATVAGIARGAGISTGNVYRYFENKEALFAAAVPPAFVGELSLRLGVQLETSRSVSDLRELPSDDPYLVAADRLLEFALRHRLRVVIVLARAEGTAYESYAPALVERLMVAAVAHHHGEDAGLEALAPPLRFDLQQVYESYVASLARILARFDDGDAIRAAVRAYQRYHLVGLRALFG